jgi:hypothetical protein
MRPARALALSATNIGGDVTEKKETETERKKSALKEKYYLDRIATLSKVHL